MFADALRRATGVDLSEPLDAEAEALIPRHLREALADLASRTREPVKSGSIAAELDRWGDSPTSHVIRRAIAQQIASRGPLPRLEPGATCATRGRRYEIAVEKGLAVARYSSAGREECVLCEGTMRLPSGRFCEGAVFASRCHSYDYAEIPGHYAHHGPEILPHDARLQLATLRPGDRGWWLTGPVGPGKTAAMCAALRVLTLDREAPPLRVRYADMTALLAALRAAYEAGRGAPGIISELVEVPVLALDDVGKLQGTGRHELRVIDEVVSARYNASDRTTFVTSNLGPGDLIARVRDLDNLDLERVVSRLAEMTSVVVMDHPDRRRFLPR